MRRLLVAAVLSSISGSAWACIQSAQSELTFTEVCIASICTRVEHSDLVERSVKKQEIEMSALLQQPYDSIIAITALPLDDPDRGLDPDQGSLYWSNDRGDKAVDLIEKTHLTGRSCEITARWDGERFQVSGHSL